MTGALLVRGASFVWTGSELYEDADVLCDAGQVVAVGADLPGADGMTVIEGIGCLVSPGLVNAHHHLLQSAFRTLPGTRHVPMREWLPTMAAAYGRAQLDAELAGAAAAVAVAEGLLCGVTTVADHVLNWPADVDGLDVAEAIADAARTLGGRLVLVRGTAGDDADAAASEAERLVGRFGARSEDGMFALAVGPAGVHSDGPETFAALREVALRHGLQRRTQANEQVDVPIAVQRHGRRPLELLEEWGWLEPGVTVAHLCEITPDELRLVAASGVTATHAPACDLAMGWGLMPAGALIDAGVTVGLGTSGGGSNDAGHLLADARLAMQASPLTGRALTALEVLGMATRGSALGLGRPALGRLDAGSAADLVLYDLRGVADAGVADPVAGLIWASPGRRPRDVVVNGVPVVRDGVLLAEDETRVANRLARTLALRGVA
ncbi:amidohydrolase family protein [Patulibacter sp. NPDC049589]|uniref:amidohydrolase family protein n=1 Tax=Patulibacter sp. NPDC049589 TaxID=3154731 RepID=UPI003432F3C5